jgi:hypothetical protein
MSTPRWLLSFCEFHRVSLVIQWCACLFLAQCAEIYLELRSGRGRLGKRSQLLGLRLWRLLVMRPPVLTWWRPPNPTTTAIHHLLLQKLLRRYSSKTSGVRAVSQREGVPSAPLLIVTRLCGIHADHRKKKAMRSDVSLNSAPAVGARWSTGPSRSSEAPDSIAATSSRVPGRRRAPRARSVDISSNNNDTSSHGGASSHVRARSVDHRPSANSSEARFGAFAASLRGLALPDALVAPGGPPIISMTPHQEARLIKGEIGVAVRRLRDMKDVLHRLVSDLEVVGTLTHPCKAAVASCCAFMSTESPEGVGCQN